MSRCCENIYQNARKSANLTQQQAAELLHISPRTLCDYESGKTVPADDIVCNMIEVYGTEWLGYQHLKQSTLVGQKYLPDIECSDLAKSVLRLQKEVSDLDNVNRDMIDIACDGVIHDHEEPRWRNITKEIYEMAGAALAVIFSR